MPIRFRCAYCNQLMGISTRKAGTVVKCPKCAGEIIVPSPDAFAEAEEPAAPPAESPPPEVPATAPVTAGGAFEAKEFEDYFNEAANGSVGATTPVRAGAAAPEPMPEAPVPPPTPPSPARRGLFLTLPTLILSVIVIFLLLVAVFVLGVVIGRQAAMPRESASTQLRSVANHDGHL